MPVSDLYVVEQRLLGSQSDAAYEWYKDTFLEINERAALRHLMNYREFTDVMWETRIDKHLVTSPEGEIVGLGVCTNQLEAWPLVSPAYFEKHWPKHYAEQRIWFVGFIGASKNASRTVFRTILRGMQKGEPGNLWFMDVCTVNKDRIEKAAGFHLRGINPQGMHVTTVDQQSFLMMNFEGEA